ncbi:MAG TPA: hypothetical protein VKR56_03330 [Candidatus Cybelea sp.]|nr:hypothetical protein [Candidatus Cybelea sp.]
MKYLCALAAILIALTPAVSSAQRGGRGGGGGARAGGGARPSGGGGFNLSRDTGRAPVTRPSQPGSGNRGNGNIGNGNGNGNNNGNRGNGNIGNGNNNGNRNTNINNGNRTNINVSGNTVIRNPVYVNNSAWGWNHGVAWRPAYGYWGGGFWGAMAIGVTSAAVFGTIAYNNRTYTSYQVQPSSPGATFLSNYQLTQVQCGPTGLVVVYGPENSVICANPNNLVTAGNYQLSTDTLTLTSM